MMLYGALAGLAILFLSRKAYGAVTPQSQAKILPVAKNFMKEPAFSKFDSLFKKYGTEYGVDWKILKAIAMVESGLGTHPSVILGLKEPSNPKSVSDDKLSWGLMQFRVSTANDLEKGITYKDLNNPDTAVRLAAKFFVWLKKQFPTDTGDVLIKKMVMSYNQGAAATKQGKTFALPYYDKFMKMYSFVNSQK